MFFCLSIYSNGLTDTTLTTSFYFAGADVVLMQPKFGIPSKADWVALNAILRSRGKSPDDDDEGEYYEADEDEVEEEQVTRRIAVAPPVESRDHAKEDAHVILIMILSLVTVCLLIFLLSRSGQTYEEEIAKRGADQEYCVGLAKSHYFYPMAAVPPPKYDEAMEAVLEAPSASAAEAIRPSDAQSIEIDSAEKAVC